MNFSFSAAAAWRRPARLGLLVAVLSAGPVSGESSEDALARYLALPDSSFGWKMTEQREVDGLHGYRLEMTSQTWHSNLWTHHMLVVRPAKVRNPDIALLAIGGSGDVDRSWSLLRTAAERGGALAAAINDVPNQPLYGGRVEDALIAYTFDRYLKTDDRTWPLLFPMVKSAVRGMDTVQAFARQELGQKVKQFVVTGASKRGWTTWLTASQDPRVAGIAPMVIDMLNMRAQTRWAAGMYGRQSERIHDYTDYNFMEHLDEPPLQTLLGWVDPYSYRARYNMPKLILLGTNDPYWVVDSLRHYWPELPNPKLIFQTPNAGHDLAGGRQAQQTLAAFFQMLADRQPLPRMTWEFTTNSATEVSIGVKIHPAAKGFRLWTADSTDRDFRNDQWSSVELSSPSGTAATATVKTPVDGFRAFIVEAEMRTASGQAYKLSTEARVTPDGPPARAAAN